MFTQSNFIYNKFFKLKVAEHTFPGYPNPPIADIFLICKSIIAWLNND